MSAESDQQNEPDETAEEFPEDDVPLEDDDDPAYTELG